MSHHCHHDHNETKSLAKVFWLNLFFAIIELIGGIMSNSVAIVADAIHDMGDALSVGLSWVFAKIAQKKRTQNFSYGWKRFSLLAALINGLILLFASVFMLQEIIPRIFEPNETNALMMIGMSVFGILVNGWAVFGIKDGKTLNQKVIKLHMLEDVLGWVAVFLGSIVIYFTQWYWLDGVLGIGVTIYIIIHAGGHIYSALKLFLQSVPENISAEKLTTTLAKISAVQSIHDLHVWSLDGATHIASLHIVVADTDFTAANLKKLKQEIRGKLLEQNVTHATIEFECEGEICELKDC